MNFLVKRLKNTYTNDMILRKEGGNIYGYDSLFNVLSDWN